MSTTESQYFALLRAALWNGPVAINGPVDWTAVMKMAQHHGNDSLISDVAVRLTGDNKPAPEMLAKMQTTLRNGLFHQMRLRQILVSAVQLLREHGIEPVLLKGFGLALLYPNPSLRQFGDVDLFVGLDKFHEACALLRTLQGGYNWGEEEDIGRHYNIEFGHYPMEIHRLSADIDDPKAMAVYEPIEREGLMETPHRIDLDGFELTVPSNEFQVFFTFFHAWHHFLTTGVGWRQVSDVAMALHVYHGQLDLKKLNQWITDMQLMQPWQAFGYLMVEQLGLPEVEMPFYDASCRRTAQRLYRNVMEVGNFSRNSKFKQHRPKRKLFRKLHSFIGIFVDFFYRARVFPSAAFVEMRSSLRQGFEKQGKPTDTRREKFFEN